MFACGVAPSDSVENLPQSWEAQSVDEPATSTHLWVVEQALRIAETQRDPGSVAAHRFLSREGCSARWRQGLFDADFLAKYNDGRRDIEPGDSKLELLVSGTSWKSHFYDPDTGMNYKKEKSPTAFTETLAHVENALASARGGDIEACYELGVALHYFTDIMQPMHAANFTSLDRPVELHSHFETFAMAVQDEFPLAHGSPAPSGDIDTFIHNAARKSKATWGHVLPAILAAYDRQSEFAMCNNSRTPLVFDHEKCWVDDADVRELAGKSLRDSQDLTAQLLSIVGNKLPAADMQAAE